MCLFLFLLSSVGADGFPEHLCSELLTVQFLQALSIADDLEVLYQ